MTVTTKSSTKNATAPVTDSSATILVIDDDPSMRTILRFSLEFFGYVVLVAKNGEEALTIAREHPELRVILLDVVMAGLSGKSLAEQLKSSLPKVRFLFCSGHPASAMARYGIDVSAGNFVQKPCRPPELQEKIEQLLTTR